MKKTPRSLRFRFSLGLALTLGTFALPSCRSAEKQEATAALEQSLPLPPNYQLPTVSQLTEEGENSSARFSPDGKSLIFLGAQKSAHPHAQIYEYSFSSRKSRRISFHDGDDSSVSYSADGKMIAYSSPTDELKENPPLIKKALHQLEKGAPQTQAPVASDLYTSALDGSHIRRWTSSPEDEREVVWHPTKKGLFFSTGDIYFIDPGSQTPRRLTSTKASKKQIAVSPDGKLLLWVEETADPESTRLLLFDSSSNQTIALFQKPGRHQHPAWHPQGKEILFSSNFQNPRNFEIYSLSTETSCLKQLSYHPRTDSHPVLSPDGRHLVFSSDRAGALQLFMMDYSPPSDCLTL